MFGELVLSYQSNFCYCCRSWTHLTVSITGTSSRNWRVTGPFRDGGACRSPFRRSHCSLSDLIFHSCQGLARFQHESHSSSFTSVWSSFCSPVAIVVGDDSHHQTSMTFSSPGPSRYSCQPLACLVSAILSSHLLISASLAEWKRCSLHSARLLLGSSSSFVCYL